MAGLKDLTNIWTNIREIDLRPLAEEAEQGLKIALIGRPGSGKHALAAQMRRDISRPQAVTQTPMLLADLETARSMAQNITRADLIILLVSDSQQNSAVVSEEHTLAQSWVNNGAKVVVFINTHENSGTGLKPDDLQHPWLGWDRRRILQGSVEDPAFLLEKFVPLMLDLLPDRHLALGRQFPLFRVPIAERLINDTCFSNAAYALSTGVAEIVPVLDIPLNVTDMVVLTKNQAFLAYKLGLALGLSTRWQDYVSEFGSVLGGAFLWRQLARSLVGLVPVWGIVPKVAISYAGTYVVGHVVLQWYLTGRQVSTKQMQEFYRQAFTRGKEVAQNLLSKRPRFRIKKPNLKLGRRNPRQLPAQTLQTCPNCGKTNSAEAAFCQYCGYKL
jgi:uncharacterized protein (DUF697 family)